MPLQLKPPIVQQPRGDGHPPWGCNQPSSPGKQSALCEFALRSPKPPSTRGSVAASRIPTSRCSRLTPQNLGHHHKPLSCLVANSSTASGLTARSKKFARAWAQCNRRSHADCTSLTRGIRAKNLSCSSDTSLKCCRPEYVAPAPADTSGIPAPVIEYVAPAPADTDATPAPVIEHLTSSPVIEYTAPAPAPSVTVATPSQQFLLPTPWQPSPLVSALTPPAW